MGVYLQLGRDALLGTFMLAGLSAVLLTVLILASFSHPLLALAVALLVAGMIAER